MSDTSLIAASQGGPAAIAPALDRLGVEHILERARGIHQVMSAVMKADVHYGVLPGTRKPCLYQPGAELLCMAFRLAPTPTIDDMSTESVVRYRVRMAAVHQVTGEILGTGVGECSSGEEKYRWRSAVSQAEWDAMPLDQRRTKFRRDGTALQVMVDPADVANTILKMAYKRALISMTRVALACSDIFDQDLEDIPAEIVSSWKGTTQAQAPASTAHQPSSEAELRAMAAPLYVEQVATKDGRKPDGTPWTRYTVRLTDGRDMTTFSAQVGAVAQRAQAEHAPVAPQVSRGKYGLELKALAIVPAPASSIEIPSAADLDAER